MQSLEQPTHTIRMQYLCNIARNKLTAAFEKKIPPPPLGCRVKKAIITQKTRERAKAGPAIATAH